MSNYICLMYHGIGGESGKYELKKEHFIRQLDLIKSNGLVGRSIEDLNREKYDTKNISITFDDGNLSDLWAAKKLADYGFSATFFMVEEYIKSGSKQYLDKTHLKEIASLGHAIGVHGKNHDWWTSKPLDCLLKELDETKNWFQDVTGTEVRSCSAPGGKLNTKVIHGMKNNDSFDFLRNSMPYYAQYKSFEVNSVAITNNEDEKVFSKKINSNAPYYLYSYAKQSLKNTVKQIIGK